MDFSSRTRVMASASPMSVARRPPRSSYANLTCTWSSGKSAGQRSDHSTRLTASGLALPYDYVQGWVALTSQAPAPAVALEPVIAPFGGSGTSTIRVQNAGYAVQWVLFAGFAMFLWGRTVKDALDKERLN